MNYLLRKSVRGVVITVLITLLLRPAIADASVIVLAVDRQGGNFDPILETQSGFDSWTGQSFTNANNITITRSPFGAQLRDRYGAGSVPGTSPISGPLEDLLRDFDSDQDDLTFTISGLNALTDYTVTLYGIDPTDNNGRGTSWYFGTDTSGTFITGFANSHSNPVIPAFSDTFMTDAAGTFSFHGAGDTSQGTSSADIVIFNGLTIETASGVIPEPATFAVWSLLGLCGIGYHWRSRRSAQGTDRRVSSESSKKTSRPLLASGSHSGRPNNFRPPRSSA